MEENLLSSVCGESAEFSGPVVLDGLSVTNRTMDLWIDVVFFSMGFREFRLISELAPIVVFRFPIELGDKLNRAKVFVRVAVTSDTPCHRQLLVLVHDFHLVDASVAGNATDARIHVCGVIEVNEFRQVVNSLPSNAAAGFPALVDWCQAGFVGVNRTQSGLTVLSGRRVTVHAGCRWRHSSVGGIKNGVVAIPTIHFQLSRVNRVTEWDRLSRLIAHVESLRVRDQSTHGSGVHASANNGQS
tara:strand:+ start:8071 stop:8799 length:729 start_codon:yes stop_codon:yes gene_type:complete